MRVSVAGAGLALSMVLGLGASSVHAARSPDDCKQAWSRAVRSYVSQNRKAAPDGTTPKDVDDEERVAQAWLAAFEPACALEEDGLKAEARVEAALLGAQILAKLDPRGCQRFLQYYMASSRPKDVCDMVIQGTGSAEIRSLIETSIPPR